MPSYYLCISRYSSCHLSADFLHVVVSIYFAQLNVGQIVDVLMTSTNA